MPRLLRRAIVVPLALLALSCGLSVRAADAPTGAAPAQAVAQPAARDTGSVVEDDFLASLEAAGKEETKAEKTPLYVTALSFIFKLALVLGLAYVSILGLKRFSALKGTVGGGGHNIRVLENSSLGANKNLHVVEVGTRRLLLASTPNQVNLITEIQEEDLPEPPPAQPSGGFKEQLAMFLGQTPGAEQAESNVAEMLRQSTSFLQTKIGEVGGLRRKLRNEIDG